MKFEEPEIIYKDLLDKGEDLTTTEVIYLHMKGVGSGRIRKVTNLTKRELAVILKNEDSVIQNHKKVVDKMAGKTTKFNMTPERAKQLKAEGKNKSEIAKIAGVSPATYTYHENKWNGKAKSNKVAPLKVKDAAPVRDHAEYTTVINDLKEKLRYSEQVVEEKDRLNREIADKNIRMAAEKIDLRAENNQLLARIEQLEQEKMDLHAAASDTEIELAKARTEIEGLIDTINVESQKKCEYRNEYNKTLQELYDTDAKWINAENRNQTLTEAYEKVEQENEHLRALVILWAPKKPHLKAVK